MMADAERQNTVAAMTAMREAIWRVATLPTPWLKQNMTTSGATMMAWYLTVAKYTALAHALRACNGNRRQAAKLLGVSRNQVYLLLRELENISKGGLSNAT